MPRVMNARCDGLEKTAVEASLKRWFVGCRINPCAYVGSFNSPAIQPAATVFIGS
jgi:hypothetical protein